MPSSCTECERLWQINADAVRVHTIIVWREYQAKSMGSASAAITFWPLCHVAEEARRSARKAFEIHSASRHALSAHAA